LLPTIPADSQFRTITEQRLEALAQARASGEIPPAVVASAQPGAGADSNSTEPADNAAATR
jgi:hypothetical protein